MTKTYKYTIAEDLAQGIHAGALDEQIDDSQNITIKLGGDRVTTSQGIAYVTFLTKPPAAELVHLDGATHDSVKARQTDATLDPGAVPVLGDRYIILDSAALHANFGSIAGLADNDVVEYDGADFVVSLDASAVGSAVLNSDADARMYSWNGTVWATTAAGGLIAAHDGSPPADEPQEVTIKSDPRHAPAFSIVGSVEGSQKIAVSHNWASPCSWACLAKLHADGVDPTQGVTLVQDGTDPKVFRSAASPNHLKEWIDASHGWIRSEDLTDFPVKVWVGGVLQKERTIEGLGYGDTGWEADWDARGIDYDVDYLNGEVRLRSDPGASVVKARFYAGDLDIPAWKRSLFFVNADPGYIYQVDRVEVQWTETIKPSGDVHFAAFAPLSFWAIQTDNTLAPQQVALARYLITDASNLHADFGTIEGLQDNDVVEWGTNYMTGQSHFVIILKASEYQRAVGINLDDGIPRTWNGTAWNMSADTDFALVELPYTRETYKRLHGYVNDAVGNYPSIPKNFVKGPRGIEDAAIMQMPFEWMTARVIRSSQNVCLGVWLGDGVPWTGENQHPYSTATFYGKVFEENGG